MNTIRAALSLLRIPPTTEDQQTAALLASLRATTDADEAARFRAMLGIRPCDGRNSNVCVAEGCYGEACIR